MHGLVAAGRLDLPRERKPGDGADGGMDLVPVEAAALARADGGAMPPRCVRIGVCLALGAAVVEEPLPVRVRGHVGSVDSDLAAHVGMVFAQGGCERINTSGDPLALPAQLSGKAVAGPMGGRPAKRIRQARMLCDQVGHPRP